MSLASSIMEQALGYCHETHTAVVLIEGAMEDAMNCVKGTQINGLLECFNDLPIHELARALMRTQTAKMPRDGEPRELIDAWDTLANVIIDASILGEPDVDNQADVHMTLYSQAFNDTNQKSESWPATLWRETFKQRAYEFASWEATAEDVDAATDNSVSAQSIMDWIRFGPVLEKGNRRETAPRKATEPLHLSPPEQAVGHIYVPLARMFEIEAGQPDENTFGVIVSPGPLGSGPDQKGATMVTGTEDAMAATEFIPVSTFRALGDPFKEGTVPKPADPVGRVVKFSEDVHGFWTSAKPNSQRPALDTSATFKQKKVRGVIPRVSYAVLVTPRETYIVGARYARSMPAIGDEDPTQWMARGVSERIELRRAGAKTFAEWTQWIENDIQLPQVSTADPSEIRSQVPGLCINRTRLMHYVIYLDNILSMGRAGVVNAGQLYHQVVTSAAQTMRSNGYALDTNAVMAELLPRGGGGGALWMMPELLSTETRNLVMRAGTMAYQKFYAPAFMPRLTRLMLVEQKSDWLSHISLIVKVGGQVVSCAQLSEFHLSGRGSASSAPPVPAFAYAAAGKGVSPFANLKVIHLERAQLQKPPVNNKSPFLVMLRKGLCPVQHLALSSPSVKGDTASWSGAEYLPHILKNLPSTLTRLDLSRTGLTPKIFLMGRSTSLRELRLSNEPGMTVDDLAQLGKRYPALQTVTGARSPAPASAPKKKKKKKKATVVIIRDDDSSVQASAAGNEADIYDGPSFTMRIQRTLGTGGAAAELLEDAIPVSSRQDGDAYGMYASAREDSDTTRGAFTLREITEDVAMPMLRNNLLPAAAGLLSSQDSGVFEPAATPNENTRLVVSVMSDDGTALIMRTEPVLLTPDTLEAESRDYAYQTVAGAFPVTYNFKVHITEPVTIADGLLAAREGEDAQIRLVIFSWPSQLSEDMPYRNARVVGIYAAVPNVPEIFGDPGSAMSELRPGTEMFEVDEDYMAYPLPLTPVPGSPPAWFEGYATAAGQSDIVISRMHSLWLAHAWDASSITLAPDLPPDVIRHLQSPDSNVSVSYIPYRDVEGSNPLIADTLTIIGAPAELGADQDWRAVVDIFSEQATPEQYAQSTRLFRMGASVPIAPAVLRANLDPYRSIDIIFNDRVRLSFSQPPFSREDIRNVPGVVSSLGPLQTVPTWSFVMRQGSSEQQETLRLTRYERLVPQETASMPFQYGAVQLRMVPVNADSVYPSQLIFSIEHSAAIQLAAARFVSYAAASDPPPESVNRLQPPSYAAALRRTEDNPFKSIGRGVAVVPDTVWTEYPEALWTYAYVVRTLLEIADLENMPRGERDARLAADQAEYDYRRTHEDAMLVVYFLGVSVEYMARRSGALAQTARTRDVYQAVLDAMVPALQWIVRAIPFDPDSRPGDPSPLVPQMTLGGGGGEFEDALDAVSMQQRRRMPEATTPSSPMVAVTIDPDADDDDDGDIRQEGSPADPATVRLVAEQEEDDEDDDVLLLEDEDQAGASYSQLTSEQSQQEAFEQDMFTGAAGYTYGDFDDEDDEGIF